MSDTTGATPPGEPEFGDGQPGAQPGGAGQQPPADPAGPYGQPPAQPYGQPPAQPYGQSQPYGQPQPQAQRYGQPQSQPYGQPGAAPYPQGGYGYPTPPSAGSAIGDGFSWAWKKFTENAGAMIGGYAVYAAALAVLGVVFFAIFIGSMVAAADPYGNVRTGVAVAGVFSYLLFMAVLLLFSYLMEAGVARASVEVMRTGRTQFGTFFKFERLGTVIGAALLVGLGTGIGILLFVIPGMAFALFAQFTLFYVMDKGLGAVDAIKASFQLVYRNFATSILLYLAVMVAHAVGSALCGVGVLVSAPVAMLMTGFVFRRLHNEAVAA